MSKESIVVISFIVGLVETVWIEPGTLKYQATRPNEQAISQASLYLSIEVGSNVYVNST
jgi:hypothetical protein